MKNKAFFGAYTAVFIAKKRRIGGNILQKSSMMPYKKCFHCSLAADNSMLDTRFWILDMLRV
jgi:hypothetical protein